MPDTARVTTALASRYRIERELGSGGMATVYLAEDLKHHRKVAVKVLRPELAATLGSERFEREIEVAARLQHPHILGLIDSGEADGYFYYVMPFVEGETLRERLARSGELPVPEAVRLLVDIAEALAAAHRAGVVHRDIKPGNVLLSGRHAMVMDFGVAKAVTEASGGEALTITGLALGTPAYMAPEQVAADPQMDGRVDIYALGVLGYELLTGHPPFHGLNAQQAFAAHASEAPVPVGVKRSGVSPALDAVIMRCLAKLPADRYQTADEVARALEPLDTPSDGPTPARARPISVVGAGKAIRWVAAAGALLLLAVALVMWKPWLSQGERPLDPNVVVVLPFRVVGADPSVHYLRQGMVDLLQAKLTGEGGPRAGDTRSVLAAVRDAGGSDSVDLPHDAVAGVAHKIGAGRVLQGSIVGPPEHLVISAALLEMPSGRSVVESSVEGPRDSLFALVDRLTAQLLALGAGASATQLSALTTTSLDALRAYLDGRAAYRRGRDDEAEWHLVRAVELDSTFALALSALIEASGGRTAGTMIDLARIERLAWRYRERMTPQDRLILSIRLGSRYPGETPWTEQIADRDRATQLMPESAEAWYHLGEALIQYGPMTDVPDYDIRARLAFEQAFTRDSLYAHPMLYLERLAFVASDMVAQRLWTGRMQALDSTADLLVLARWDLLATTRDRQGIRAFLAGIDSLPPRAPRWIVQYNPLDSVTIAHQAELLDANYRRATTADERGAVAAYQVMMLLNRGRPSEARGWLDTLRRVDPEVATFWPAIGAVYWNEELSDGPAIPDQTGYLSDLWQLSRGDLAAGDHLVARLRAAKGNDTLTARVLAFASVVEAWLAVQRGAPTARGLTDMADSMLQGWCCGYMWARVARLYEAQGRTDRALRAVRRRWHWLGQPDMAGLAESLRLEGRLAARAGDRAGAIRAYRNYLRMRVDPEPSRIPQRDSVRAELAAVVDLERPR